MNAGTKEDQRVYVPVRNSTLSRLAGCAWPSFLRPFLWTFLIAALWVSGTLLRPAPLWSAPLAVRFSEGTVRRGILLDRRLHATHYVLKVEIGGLAGVVAPLVGKQPPDSHVWIQKEARLRAS